MVNIVYLKVVKRLNPFLGNFLKYFFNVDHF